MKNNKKVIIFSSIIIFLLVLGLIIVSYAYFFVEPQIKNNLNLNVVIKQGDGYEFVVNGTVNTSLNVDGYDMLYNDSLEDDAIEFTSDNASFNVSFTSKTDTACNYDLYWIWDTTSDAYTLTSGATTELEYNLISDSDTLVGQLNNSYDDFYIATKTINSSSNNTTTINYTAKLNFYNLNLVQDAHANKTYSGYFSVKNVNCYPNGTQEFVTYLLNNVVLRNTQEQKDAYYENTGEELPGFYPVEYGGSIITGNNYLVDFTGIQVDSDVLSSGYRYIGPNPDNYVRFNNELWRIIGIFEEDVRTSDSDSENKQQLIKLIRETPIYTAYTYGTQSYANTALKTALDTTSYAANGNIASIKYQLYPVDSISDVINIYWYETIFESAYYASGATYTYGKVFIPRLSDYSTASSGLTDVGVEDDYSYAYCVGNSHGENNPWSRCDEGDWLSKTNSYWTTTASTENATDMYIVNQEMSTASITSSHDVYPVVYLKTDIRYSGGTGTASDPYTIYE